MFCKHCGGNLSASDTKCKRCGKAVPARSDCGGFYDLVPGKPVAAAPVAAPAPASHGEPDYRREPEGGFKPPMEVIIIAAAALTIILILFVVIFVSIGNLKNDMATEIDLLNDKLDAVAAQEENNKPAQTVKVPDPTEDDNGPTIPLATGDETEPEETEPQETEPENEDKILNAFDELLSNEKSPYTVNKEKSNVEMNSFVLTSSSEDNAHELRITNTKDQFVLYPVIENNDDVSYKWYYGCESEDGAGEPEWKELVNCTDEDGYLIIEKVLGNEEFENSIQKLKCEITYRDEDEETKRDFVIGLSNTIFNFIVKSK